MAQPIIEPMVHRCVIQSGSLAGNKASQDITRYDIEYENKCDICGEELAPLHQVIAHIYDNLVNP